VLHLLVPPFVHFVVFVRVVMFSKLDAVVHMTPSVTVTVLVVSVVVLHLLVPLIVQFDAVSKHSQ
jgi:hypothetical protein